MANPNQQQKADTPAIADQFERLIAALTAQAEKSTPLDADTLKQIMLETNRTARKEAKPENETHPGISAFSYPEGDVARPRPVLPFEFYLNAYPCHKFPETEHWRELELMTQVQPGEFVVLRRDGTPMAVTVKADKDALGKITKLSVEFPISREEKALVPPKVSLLYQLVHTDPNRQKVFIESMNEALKVMFAQVPA